MQFSYFTKDCQNKLVCRGCDSKTPLIYHLHLQRFWRDFFSSSYCQSSTGYSPLMHLSIKHVLFKSCFLSSFSNNQYTWQENWALWRITSNRAFAQAPCYLDFFWYGLFNIILPTAEFSFLESYPSWAFIPLIYYHSRRANCFSALLECVQKIKQQKRDPFTIFSLINSIPFFSPSSFESTGKLEFIEFRHVH